MFTDFDRGFQIRNFNISKISKSALRIPLKCVIIIDEM